MSWMTELKRDRFVFVGVWTSSFFPLLTLLLAGYDHWDYFRDELVYSRVGKFLSGGVQTFLLVAVSTPADAMGHSLLLLWGPENQGDFVRWIQARRTLGFCGAPRGFALIGFKSV